MILLGTLGLKGWCYLYKRYYPEVQYGIAHGFQRQILDLDSFHTCIQFKLVFEIEVKDDFQLYLGHIIFCLA